MILTQYKEVVVNPEEVADDVFGSLDYNDYFECEEDKKELSSAKFVADYINSFLDETEVYPFGPCYGNFDNVYELSEKVFDLVVEKLKTLKNIIVNKD